MINKIIIFQFQIKNSKRHREPKHKSEAKGRNDLTFIILNTNLRLLLHWSPLDTPLHKPSHMFAMTLYV
jgi:hypothetical protein